MSRKGYVPETWLIREKAVCREVLEKAVKRTRRLALFIDNNPYYFNSTYQGGEVIRQICKETIAAKENAEAFRTFML